jgi:hypothetical protein
MWYEKDVVKKSAPQNAGSPSELIDGRIRELDDWRGETLSRLRTLIKEADPEVVEEVHESGGTPDHQAGDAEEDREDGDLPWVRTTLGSDT